MHSVGKLRPLAGKTLAALRLFKSEPHPGDWVTVVHAGSSTRVPLYFDAAGKRPAPNPLTALSLMHEGGSLDTPIYAEADVPLQAVHTPWVSGMGYSGPVGGVVEELGS